MVLIECSEWFNMSDGEVIEKIDDADDEADSSDDIEGKVSEFIEKNSGEE